MSISAYVISKYEEFSGFEWRKNKAKQSQYTGLRLEIRKWMDLLKVFEKTKPIYEWV